MEAVALTGFEPAVGHVAADAGVVVVFLNVCDDRPAVPLGIQSLCDPALPMLVAAAVADEHDVPESVRLQAASHVGQHRFEGVLPHRERARAPHMSGLRLDLTFRNQLDDRRAESVAQSPRDGVAVGFEHVIVLARDQPGPVRLDSARWHDGSGLAVGQSIPDVHPGHFLDPYRVRRGERVGGVGAVVDVVPAVAAAHRAWVRRPPVLRLGWEGNEQEQKC